MSAYISGATLNAATNAERLLQIVQDRLLTEPGTRPGRLDYGGGLLPIIDEYREQIPPGARFRIQSILEADPNISVTRVRFIGAGMPHETQVEVSGVSPLAAGEFRITI